MLESRLARLTDEQRARLGHVAAQTTIAWVRELRAQGRAISEGRGDARQLYVEVKDSAGGLRSPAPWRSA